MTTTPEPSSPSEPSEEVDNHSTTVNSVGNSSSVEVERNLRDLLAAHCWTHFRVEDPSRPLSDRRPGSRPPPGKYIEICHACGEQRGDPHLPTCPIGRALRGTQ